MSDTAIDDVDEEILAVLGEDARTPNRDIADRVGVSEDEVAQRVQRLQDEEVITKFAAMIDPAKLGYVSVAFGFSVEPGKADDIAETLGKYDNIYKLWILSGRHNVIAHANFEDITEFQEFSSETLHDIDGITNYETSIATKTIINEGNAILTDR